MANLTKEAVLNDMNEAAERMGLDLEDLVEMIEDVIEDCQGKAIIIRDSIASGDTDQIKAVSHDIKGSCANYGLLAPSETAKVIENAFDQSPTDTADSLIDQLNTLAGLGLES